jgi:hypothetical protein
MMSVASPEWPARYDAAFPGTWWADGYLTSATKPENAGQYVIVHRNGIVEYAMKSTERVFHCVRGGGSIDRDLAVDTSSGDRVVTDWALGRIWQGCNLGRTGTDCATGSSTAVATWEQALAECESLSYGGYDDWRLPDLQELFSLLILTRTTGPFLDTDAFLLAASMITWSSTTYAPEPDRAITPRFDYTEIFPNLKAGGGWNSVRCIRNL